MTTSRAWCQVYGHDAPPDHACIAGVCYPATRRMSEAEHLAWAIALATIETHPGFGDIDLDRAADRLDAASRRSELRGRHDVAADQYRCALIYEAATRSAGLHGWEHLDCPRGCGDVVIVDAGDNPGFGGENVAWATLSCGHQTFEEYGDPMAGIR